MDWTGLGLNCFLCVCDNRSDSDSEGENPEKKKLQEQLMGEWTSALFIQSALDLHLRGCGFNSTYSHRSTATAEVQ